MNLRASLIVRDEIDRYLKPCIEHLEAFCDSIVVIDDASTDGTFEWIAERGHHVLQLPSSEGFFDGHEGRRRQFLLDETLSHYPPADWILNIDADEFISDGALLRQYAMSSQRPTGTLSMEEVWKAPAEAVHIRMDGGWRPHNVPVFWRVEGGRKYRIADRALACGREPEFVRSRIARSRPTGVQILHFGWSKESARQARYDRYVVADGGKFHQNAHLDSIMWPDAGVTLNARPWPEALAPVKDQIVAASA